ncbi:ESX secretion-associated protein EspG [Nocardia australiensis]|uniref:ESX secretion-associated protein EspG n=1 Tax=Nocardia australiensis TaxID=2887191 RepID=UPI001D156051|nr:ESX secretion-associated protein EspG [Nocardia australiensis]
MSWTLTPDQFALAWARTDGDRIPYPLAVRLSARDSVERAAQLPTLEQWCDRTLDADLEAALRLLGSSTVLIEIFGRAPDASAVRLVRVLGASSGNISVVAAQRAGATPERGGDIRLFVGGAKSLSARMVSMLPENTPGTTPRLTAPQDRVKEDSRDLVTVPVSGPTVSARIRRMLSRPRAGIGQIVVSVRRANGELRPFGVLCWIDVAGDGRYVVRTGADVDIVPVTAELFAAQLSPMVTAAERAVAHAERW